MARFTGGIGGVQTLQLQLTTPSLMIAAIVEAGASGESNLGGASLPVLTRPSTPGVRSSGTAVPMDGVSTPLSVFASGFSTPPSTPSVPVGSFNLPRRFRRVYAQGFEFWLLPSSSALLYAGSTAPHTWSGYITWEER